MRFSAVILPALAGLTFAADPSTNASPPMSSVAASLSSAASSKAEETMSKTTPAATPSTTGKELHSSSTAVSTGAAITINTGEAGGVVVAVLGAIAWAL
ncbi:hypothetical protein AALT_g10435 [Alternaria alternata]|nr:hypothetical protein AALT_g10435 [Alternaria alternata]